MFTTKKFIDVSRKFVCVRIDSYESKEHQEWVRRFLNGRFANTAFCVLTPDGNDWLTRASRGPNNVFNEADSLQGMQAIAKKYPVKFDQSQAVVQDFHSLGQALNVASADQRLLVLVAGPKDKTAKASATLGPVLNQANMLGRFHVNFETGAEWKETIFDEKADEGIMFVASSEFGVTGKVLQQLPLDATAADINDALIASNATFAATTQKKDYASHVAKGHRLGIRYESAVPYGEDRDGDGVIDHRGGAGRRPRRRN